MTAHGALAPACTAQQPASTPEFALLHPQRNHNLAGADDADYNGELVPYITGDKKAPVPTYFIGGFGAGSRQALEALAAAPECGIHYLGRSGVRTVEGLTVAFLDGTYNSAAYKASAGGSSEGGASSGAGNGAGPGCRFYEEADVAAVKRQLANAQGDIDLLLTNEWPAGVCIGLPDAALPQGPASLSGECKARGGVKVCPNGVLVVCYPTSIGIICLFS